MSQVERPLVVTFGEMLLRLSPGDRPRLFDSDQLRAGFGGAEANVAVSLAHFDISCEYITRLPENLIGDAAIATLRAEGVQVNRVLRGPERMGLYFVEPGADVGNSGVVYDRAGSAFAAMTPSSLDWSTVFGGVAWFHATGITAALGPGSVATLHAAIAAARADGVPVSVDLNYRPALWHDRDPARIVAPLIRGIDLLIANPHSARAMLGLDVADDAFATPDGARALAQRIVEKVGCHCVALTRREVMGSSVNRWSAVLFDGATDEIVVSRPWTVTVIDRIGGGDAFAAALIAALLQARDPLGALEFAVAASALKLRVAGDFNRVRVADVDRLLGGMDAAGARVGELRA